MTLTLLDSAITPVEVSVRVTDGSGAVLADQTMVPEYHEGQPNGFACPPVCQRASVMLDTARV